MKSSRRNVIGLGEVLWDLLPSGPQLGGAPANFACHAKQLGANAHLVSCLGQDELADQAWHDLQQHGVAVHGIERNKHPTGTVEVTLDGNDHPSYSITENVAWDFLRWSDSLAQLASTADAVCFGTLGQRSETSRQTIQKFIAATPDDSLRIFDVNLRAPFFDDAVVLQSLALANVLKLNDEELPIVASICGFKGSETEVLRQLSSRFDLSVIALTQGAEGATIFQAGKIFQERGIITAVVDSVGAGDAYTATLAVGLLMGHELVTINNNACRVAAYVCSQAGATPRLSRALSDLVLKPSPENRLKLFSR